MNAAEKYRPPDRPRRAALTDREREIALLIARGYRKQEIAAVLSISHQLVQQDTRAIFQKLGVNDLLELALYVATHGLWS